MDRQAALRFAAALKKKLASLPGTQLHTELDLLARVQFFEGLTHHRFGSISTRAAASKSTMVRAIKEFILEIDPTMDVRMLTEGSTPSSIWLDPTGPIGLYKGAWLGATRVFGRAKSVGGPGAQIPQLEASDLLNEMLLRSMDPATIQSRLDRIRARVENLQADKAKLSDPERSRIDVQQMADLQEEDDLAQQLATAEAAQDGGNFFWLVGFKLSKRAKEIITGELEVGEIKGMVARYAASKAKTAVVRYNTEMERNRKAIEQSMVPTEDDSHEFDYTLGSLSDTGWNKITQWVMDNNNHPLTQELFDWIVTDLDMAVAEGKMSDRDATVVRVYIDDFVRTHVGMMDNDAGFVRYFNQTNLIGLEITRQQFSNLWKQYLGRVHKRLEDDPPQWFIDMADQVFLQAAQKGRGRFAGEKTPMNRIAAEERRLRAKLIRLAHSKPELRPVILPLIKQADKEGPAAGRTWGTPDPGAPWDWDHPYAKHPGHPPAGTDGSPARKKYNDWYRENVCPTEHATGCGREWE